MAAADPHPTTPTTDVPPMSDAELLADRQQFWQSFTRFLVWSVAVTAATLALMAIFLV
jgi:hypothetical protein